MTLEDAKKRLLTEEGFRKAYEELQEEYDKIKADMRRKENPWHTGTPTEYGLYLVKYIHGGYDVVLYDPSASGWDIYSDDSPKDIVKWQKIEEN